MMRVLVFEQWRGGHYFDYLKCLLPRLSELASEVVVTLPRRALELRGIRGQDWCPSRISKYTI